MQGHSWALFKPRKCLVQRPLYVQALNQQKKGAQMQAQGKQPKVAKVWAWGQHLMRDIVKAPTGLDSMTCTKRWAGGKYLKR